MRSSLATSSDAPRTAPICPASSTSCTPRTDDLTISANGFARAMSRAFTQVGRRRQAVRRRAEVAGAAAVQPGADARRSSRSRSGIAGGLSQLFAGLFGGAGGGRSVAAAMGAIKPFAAGGVIGTPTYFPLVVRRPRACRRGRAGGDHAARARRRRPARRRHERRRRGANVTVQIATPDADSFRRSEAYLTGQIARAVARGQRSLAR